MRSNHETDNKEFAKTIFGSMRSPGKVNKTCLMHGDYVSDVYKFGSRINETPCPQCFEIQKAKDDKAEQERMAEEHRQIKIKADKRRMEEKTGAAMIPKRFLNKRFDDYQIDCTGQQRALDACKDYAHNFSDNLEAGRCLILSGKVGTGKTHLAASIADYLINQTEYSAVFRSLHSILQAIKNTYGEGSASSELEVFNILTKPDLLIIDEIGATKSTEFELATLFALINTRYENQLPTVIITNLEAKELAGSIGDRCVDRLRENGGRALMFDWESKRKGA